MKRLAPTVLIAMLLFLPLTVSADSLPVSNGGTEAPNSSSNALQPSAPTSIQSSPASNGLEAPSNSSDLQGQPSSQDINSYLSGELVGSPTGNNAGSSTDPTAASWLDWLATVILLAFVAAVGAYYANRQRRESQAAFVREMPSEAQSSKAPLSTELADTIAAEHDAENDEAVAPVATEAEPKPKAPTVKGAGRQAQNKHKSKPKNKKKARKH